MYLWIIIVGAGTLTSFFVYYQKGMFANNFDKQYFF